MHRVLVGHVKHVVVFWDDGGELPEKGIRTLPVRSSATRRWQPVRHRLSFCCHVLRVEGQVALNVGILRN